MRKVALHIDDAGLLDRIAILLADEAGIDTLHTDPPDVGRQNLYYDAQVAVCDRDPGLWRGVDRAAAMGDSRR